MIDSNVLIAATSTDHLHHVASLQALQVTAGANFATTTHCLSECYSNLTRSRSNSGGALTPSEASAALARFSEVLEILTLSVIDHEAALRAFARADGTGPRVYDYLIGYVALVHETPAVVTWNTRHFIPLFPTLHIVTPAELLETL